MAFAHSRRATLPHVHFTFANSRHATLLHVHLNVCVVHKWGGVGWDKNVQWHLHTHVMLRYRTFISLLQTQVMLRYRTFISMFVLCTDGVG